MNPETKEPVTRVDWVVPGAGGTYTGDISSAVLMKLELYGNCVWVTERFSDGTVTIRLDEPVVVGMPVPQSAETK